MQRPTYEEVVALWHELRPEGWEDWPIVPDVHWFPDHPGLVRIWDFYDEGNTVYLDMRERCIVDINGDNEEFEVELLSTGDFRILRPVDPTLRRLVEEGEAANTAHCNDEEWQAMLDKAKSEMDRWSGKPAVH